MKHSEPQKSRRAPVRRYPRWSSTVHARQVSTARAMRTKLKVSIALVLSQLECIRERLNLPVAQRIDEAKQRHRALFVRLGERLHPRVLLARGAVAHRVVEQSRVAERFALLRRTLLERDVGIVERCQKKLDRFDARQVRLHEAAELVGEVDVLHPTLLACDQNLTCEAKRNRRVGPQRHPANMTRLLNKGAAICRRPVA